MRVRLQTGGLDTLLEPSLPRSGHVLHPESNRAEWAILALDQPVSVAGVTAELLWLRPAVSGRRVGDPAAIHVHVALVVGVGEVESRPVYRLGGLLGQVVCEAEPDVTALPPI
jgi:hypothetical protein